jgi:hypothetical protein
MTTALLEQDESITCLHCDNPIDLDDFKRLLSKQLSGDDKRSIVGSLAASMRHTIGTAGGRHKDMDQPRCPCGAMTLKRAMSRRHFDALTGTCRYLPENTDSEKYYKRRKNTAIEQSIGKSSGWVYYDNLGKGYGPYRSKREALAKGRIAAAKEEKLLQQG